MFTQKRTLLFLTVTVILSLLLAALSASQNCRASYIPSNWYGEKYHNRDCRRPPIVQPDRLRHRL